MQLLYRDYLAVQEIPKEVDVSLWDAKKAIGRPLLQVCNVEGFKGHADGQGRGDQTVAKLAVIAMTSQWQRPGWTEWTSFGYVKSTVFGRKVLWP